MIDDLVQDLKSDEGWAASAYQDTEGWWTIGYGFLIDGRRGGELPKQIAEQWLHHNVISKWAELTSRIPWLLDQPEDVQRAIGNMAYQLGVSGVLKFQNMLNCLLAGDRAMAAEEALDSRWAKQTPNRAQRVASLIRGS